MGEEDQSYDIYLANPRPKPVEVIYLDVPIGLLLGFRNRIKQIFNRDRKFNSIDVRKNNEIKDISNIIVKFTQDGDTARKSLDGSRALIRVEGGIPESWKQQGIWNQVIIVGSAKDAANYVRTGTDWEIPEEEMDILIEDNIRS